MKKFLTILTVTLLSSILYTQVVVTNPVVPVTDQPVTITFYAAEGNGGLAGYTGDVYAHTGVITENSTGPANWKYVKTDWGENTPETRLTCIADDVYTLSIAPDIRAYYGVPQNEAILQLALVFRSQEPVGGEYLAGREADGGDIFVAVVESGLNILFVQPEIRPALLEPGENLFMEAFANEAETMSLYEDDVFVKTVSGTSLAHTFTPAGNEVHWVKVIAENSDMSVADSFFYLVRPLVTQEERPAGIRDGINYIDNQTLVLSLLAPGKDYVYVIGDFNNWHPNNDYFMKMTPDGERFWLEINNLDPGREYIFQYLIDGELRLGDPYADKVSDPWNDHFISQETYPGLIAYPEGKTSGIATVLQTAQEEYQWEVENFIPAKTTDLVIYECLVRDFTEKHSYAAIIDTLDYLQRLGVNALELMPVNEFEGNLSWGYNPSFYFAPDKYYGPKNELKRLVDECHKRGIAVILDIVLNHSYDQSPLVQMYFDGNNPAPQNPWYNSNHNFANPDAWWGNDFDHESLYTQNFVDSVNSYWMSEYKMDGFRFDFTKGFSNTYHTDDDPWGSNYDAARVAILKRMVDAIHDRNDDAIVIFEHLAENSEEKVLANYGILLWGNMNYHYAEAAMGYNTGDNSNLSGISYKARQWTYPHLVGYMESHDEERIMYKNITYGNSQGYYNIQDTSVALDRIRLVSTFFYTVPGPKMIWQFGELGYDYSIDYNGRLGEKPVRWDYYNDWRRNYNYHFISSLISLRKNYDVFETGNFEMDVNNGEMKTIRLFGDTMQVIVVGNFGVGEGNIQPVFGHTGIWYEYFSGDTLQVADADMQLTLRRGEYRVYTDKHLEAPDIGTSVNDPPYDRNTGLRGFIYPNPTDEDATLAIHLNDPQYLRISVSGISGIEFGKQQEQYYSEGFHNISLNTASLDPGIYLCVIDTGQFTEAIKFIKE